jgi:hypothetical protein
MVKLADDFEAAVGEIVETVFSAPTELEDSASTNAQRAQELTTLVAAASEEATTNVPSVASATEYRRRRATALLLHEITTDDYEQESGSVSGSYATVRSRAIVSAFSR